MASDDVTTLRISSSAASGKPNALSSKDRIEEFLEIFGRTILKIDIEPLDGHPLEVDMTLRSFPSIGIASGNLSPMRNSTRRQSIDNDDPVLVAVESGQGAICQAGREATVRDGEAVLTSGESAGIFTGITATRVSNFRLDRARLVPMVDDLDGALLRPIPATNRALRLLTAYAGVLNDPGEIGTAELRGMVVSHIHDLAALALGATQEAAVLAQRGGVRAARLRAIKADIVGNIGDPGLSLAALAQRHGISPSYIRQLMADEATTFTDFVLDHRLLHAYRMLCNPQLTARAISSIAFESGFGDLSYFNRTFRRRFGMTPGDVRAANRRDL